MTRVRARALVVAGVLLLVLLPGCAQSVPTTAPIVGVWDLAPEGGVFEFVPSEGNTFVVRVIEPRSGPCADKDGQITVSGSGLKYSGTWRYYSTATCAWVGYGPIAITLDEGAKSGSFSSQPPPPSTCCEQIGTMKRRSRP